SRSRRGSYSSTIPSWRWAGFPPTAMTSRGASACPLTRTRTLRRRAGEWRRASAALRAARVPLAVRLVDAVRTRSGLCGRVPHDGGRVDGVPAPVRDRGAARGLLGQPGCVLVL